MAERNSSNATREAFNAWLDAEFYGIRLTDAEVNAMQAAFTAGASLPTSDTSRIDAARIRWDEVRAPSAPDASSHRDHGYYVSAQFARQLVRELREAQRERGELALKNAAPQGSAGTCGRAPAKEEGTMNKAQLQEARYRGAIHALEDAAIAMARSANTGAIYPQELKRAIRAAQDAIDKAPTWIRSRK